MKKNSGLTLLETFIAMSILTFCTAILFASLYLCFNLVNDIRENIIASSVIQQKIEELRKTFFVSMPSYGESSFTDAALSKLYNASAKIEVSQCPYAGSDPNIILVAAEVSWYSRLNTSKQNIKKAMTFITRNGINSI